MSVAEGPMTFRISRLPDRCHRPAGRFWNVCKKKVRHRNRYSIHPWKQRFCFAVFVACRHDKRIVMSKSVLSETHPVKTFNREAIGFHLADDVGDVERLRAVKTPFLLVATGLVLTHFGLLLTCVILVEVVRSYIPALSIAACYGVIGVLFVGTKLIAVFKTASELRRLRRSYRYAVRFVCQPLSAR